MVSVEIYTREHCGYCTRAKEVLDKQGCHYKEIKVTNAAQKSEMIERSGGRTFPQVFISGRAIGGCTELMALDQSGELKKLLSKEGES